MLKLSGNGPIVKRGLTPGSMFSDNDFVSPGADFAHIGNGIGTDLWSAADSQFGAAGFGEVARHGRLESADPEDEGNMGVSFKWLHEKLNNTEFGFMECATQVDCL